MSNFGHTMKSLPMLKGLREAQSISQRALSRKSGVAHDTIGQIERGERRARSSTVQKLAAALNSSPCILASTLEKLSSLSIGELYKVVEEELADADAVSRAISGLQGFLIFYGYTQVQTEWEERKSAAAYESLLEDIDLAHKKLIPSENNVPDKSITDELVEMTEATLLLARASAQLLRFVTGELEALHQEAEDDFRKDRGRLGRGNRQRVEEISRHSYHRHLAEFDRFGRPLADAWLEGAAAIKGLRDFTSEVPHSRVDGALQSEPEIEGGDQEAASTKR